jgi:hypothetical protein
VLTSNQLSRAVSRSGNDPSLSMQIHAQGGSGWFAGLWAATSRVRPFDDTSLDVAATLGLGGTLGSQWSWRASLSHYENPWQTGTAWYRYNELTLDVQLRDTLLFSASWSPDTSAYSIIRGPALNRDAFAWEVSYQHVLAPALRGFAGAGYYDLSDHFGEGYWYASAGLGWSWRRWRVELAYVHPGPAAERLTWPGTARRRAVASLGYDF